MFQPHSRVFGRHSVITFDALTVHEYVPKDLKVQETIKKGILSLNDEFCPTFLPSLLFIFRQ